MSGAQEAKQLPDKLYFKIGEVSEYTGLKAHTIRYWEKEFVQIKPTRRRNQRMYDREAIFLILRIKTMLHKENYTIEGARKKLKQGLPVSDGRQRDKEILTAVLEDLEQILGLLDDKQL
ncbi:MAG: MerR family transcriptional regulator [Candidatus Mycalebacterium zealandia]|nr:MAG: MerR family transcriptional regulator [Candidatus Mycalebacterium zealandia]